MNEEKIKAFALRNWGKPFSFELWKELAEEAGVDATQHLYENKGDVAVLWRAYSKLVRDALNLDMYYASGLPNPGGS